MQNLVIVESPTKARTLSKFLGSKYKIEASMGHIRDLPKSELGVDVEHNFEPKYIIPRDKKKKFNELKKLAKEAKTIWLASDPDREGEAIAWHLTNLVDSKDKKDVKRVEFHEITESAIKAAFEHPRLINQQLVDAQQARRILDRLVGYKLSPLLWKKVKRGLSAGRVQSVALRLIVERQREIDKFLPVEFWSISVEVTNGTSFWVDLVALNGQKIEVKNQPEAETHVNNLLKASYSVSKIDKKEVRRFPQAPFTTSTLQQTAGNRLGYSAKKTMMLAQNLYENGLITYMRTDSVNLSTQAIAQVREVILKLYGKNYLPSSARMFKAKSKNAQEAHEAIRPTSFGVQSSEVGSRTGFTKDHARLYDLIWKRTLACQMAEAVADQTTVDVSADNYTLKTTGSVIKFDGWLKLFGKVKDEIEEEPTDAKAMEGKAGFASQEAKNQVLPELKAGEDLSQLQVLPKQHFTEPPPKYTEASLIKKLEELGIGRPSTFAPILSTIQERFYVERVERKFTPTALGLTVNDFLMKYFPDIFDFEFTASMEDKLDEISRGEREWKQTIGEFYEPFEKKLSGTMENAEHVQLEVEKVDKKCPECGRDLLVRTGKFGKFLACSGFPDCKYTEAYEEKIEAKCPLDGGDVLIRKTKKGRIFYGCKNYPKCTYASWTKPK